MMEKQSLLESLLLQVEKSKSFQSIMEDGKVTDSEIEMLSDRVNSLMAQAEEKLSDEDFKLVSEILTEFAVFYVVTNIKEKDR
ncbi:MAG: hypothetical protein IJW23_01090 [Lentisphaeria bacterium]|nr:hypothetical protein [Lentisphaeria bacterium]